MLDPNEIIKLSEGSEKIASELQEDIVEAICERIAIRLGRGDDYILTPRDKWGLEVLKDAGYLVDDLVKIIAEKTGITKKEMRKAFAKAGVSSTKFDDVTYINAGIPVTPIQQSPSMIRMLERGYNKTLGEWQNYTGTTVNSAYNLFVRECDKAYNAVLSGSVGYGEAVKRALVTASIRGGFVEYPSGHTDSLEVATYRAVRTGISQAASDITSVRASENGITLFVTSSHLGARPTHEPWQGKVFWVDWNSLSQALGINYDGATEASESEKRRYDEFVETTEIGTVTGLCGANCRHSYGPFIEGVSHNPFEQFDSEENRKRYEIEQEQRARERAIRRQKRKVEGLKSGLKKLDPDVAEETKNQLRTEEKKLAQMRKDYKSFSESNDLKEQTHRLEVAMVDYGSGTAKTSTVLIEPRALSDEDAFTKRCEAYYNKLVSQEPETTALVQSVAKKHGMTMEGLDFRKKTMQSYMRKATKEQTVKMNDLVRYTYMADEDTLVEKAQGVLADLEANGHKVVKFKNYWNKDDNPYMGINVNLELSDGDLFEVQFHTPESLEIKEENHKLYELQRVLEDTESEEFMKYNDGMWANSLGLKRPKGIDDFIWRIITD